MMETSREQHAEQCRRAKASWRPTCGRHERTKRCYVGETGVTTSPLAGKPAPPNVLVDVPRLVTAYYTEAPDRGWPARRFGLERRDIAAPRSKGASTNRTFSRSRRPSAISAETAGGGGYGDPRRRDIDRPLFLGVDTHTLSAPAQASALAVFAANGVEVMLAQNDEYTSGGAVVEPALPRHADPSTSTTAAVGARRKPAR